MKNFKLEDMFNGWFVGDFSPTVFTTKDCEVAIKSYQKGNKEEEHYHKIATEITVIIEGRVRMCGQEWGKGDIIIVEPGESTAFEALSKCTNVVVKIPGAVSD